VSAISRRPEESVTAPQGFRIDARTAAAPSLMVGYSDPTPATVEMA
jgi:hypothetical protein